MKQEYITTTINIEKSLHKRAKMYCAMNETNVTALMTGLLADFMKGKRVR